jgi:broad specificity phosphatase PhoE
MSDPSARLLAFSALPSSMLQALPLLPDLHQPLILLTRHSVRERTSGQGFASYDLPLTPAGRQLAEDWGHHLAEQTGRWIAACLSSPIQRCIDTATLMLDGQSRHDSALTAPPVHTTALLVEPGSFVVDVVQAGPLFRQHGPLNFINHFLDNALPGMKQPHQGVFDILALLHAHQSHAHSTLLLAVSHDTILAALLAVMAGHARITWDDWPDMMEGVFLWFEGETFDQSHLHWVWRGQQFRHPIQGFAGIKPTNDLGGE